jgi:PAT family beta-lactamase induction signal transducer AmpG
MGTTAFVAFMASLTDKRFTATQYALLTSFMGIPRVFAGSTTGLLASWLGWEGFFFLCTILALPGLLLIAKLRRMPALVAIHQAPK